MSTENQYAERDTMWLDQQGWHYVRHVDRMTREGLHSKSDIAAELGWRDYQIAELTRQVSALQTSQDNIINGLGINGDGPYSKLVIEYVMRLVAENVALKSFGNRLDEMHNDLNGSGTGIQGGAEVACQQVALEAAMEEFDAIQTPATNGAIAEIKAGELDDLAKSIMEYAPVIESDEYHVYEVIAKDVTDRAANLRAGRKG